MADPEAVEEKAKRMGWVPQDDFKGADDKWVDAERFVERGENELPIMRERMRKMDGTIVGLNNTISGMKDTFGEFQKHQKGVAEKAYDRALKDITNKQRQAVKDGDTAGFDAAEKEKEKLILDTPPAVPTETKGQDEFDAWVADGNDWFNTDPELQKYASTMSVYLQDQKKLGGTALYDEVKKEVALRFPDKFENKNRAAPTTVVGGGEAPTKPGKQNFASLPADAQAQCKKFIKEIPGFTKEQYVKDYEW